MPIVPAALRRVYAELDSSESAADLFVQAVLTCPHSAKYLTYARAAKQPENLFSKETTV